jgi:hypothetical protein
MLYFVFNRDVVGVVVAHDLAAGEFVAQVPYFPPLQSPSDFTDAVCAQLVAAAAGLPASQLPDLSILQARPWVMSALVADKLSVTAGPTAGGKLVAVPNVASPEWTCQKPLL